MMQTFLVVTQKTFLMRIYSSHLNILCFFFHVFIFLGTNIKGTIFSGRVRSHPSHPPQLRACHYSIQSVRHLGPKIWNIVHKNIRESNWLNEFKILIKFWKPDSCPCRRCKNYIAQVGFIWSYIHLNYLSYLFKSFFF